MACQQIAEQAKREALARLRDNQRINDAEFAYSPSTGAVGMRWDESQIFRVFNVNYPMYQQSESVTDWVSIGALRAAEAKLAGAQALADEKCRCFLNRAEFAEAERDQAWILIDALLCAPDLHNILRDGAPLWFRDVMAWYERNKPDEDDDRDIEENMMQ